MFGSQCSWSGVQPGCWGLSKLPGGSLMLQSLRDTSLDGPVSGETKMCVDVRVVMCVCPYAELVVVGEAELAGNKLESSKISTT